MSVAALVVLPTTAGPELGTLVEALFEGGLPVLGGRTPSEAVAVLPWISDDGPRRVRVAHGRGVPDGLLGPRSPEAEELEGGRSHLRIVLEEGPEERLERDLLLVEAVAALAPRLRAVACRLEHNRGWIHAEDWVRLAQQDAGFGVPGELLVDLQIGPVGPEAVGVLSDGLERYGFREVLAVADRARLEPAWRLAASLVEDRLLGAEPEVDLHTGPHPTRPTDRVDVGFVDEEPDEQGQGGLDIENVGTEEPS